MTSSILSHSDNLFVNQGPLFKQIVLAQVLSRFRSMNISRMSYEINTYNLSNDANGSTMTVCFHQMGSIFGFNNGPALRWPISTPRGWSNRYRPWWLNQQLRIGNPNTGSHDQSVTSPQQSYHLSTVYWSINDNNDFPWHHTDLTTDSLNRLSTLRRQFQRHTLCAHYGEEHWCDKRTNFVYLNTAILFSVYFVRFNSQRTYVNLGALENAFVFFHLRPCLK